MITGITALMDCLGPYVLNGLIILLANQMKKERE